MGMIVAKDGDLLLRFMIRVTVCSGTLLFSAIHAFVTCSSAFFAISFSTIFSIFGVIFQLFACFSQVNAKNFSFLRKMHFCRRKMHSCIPAFFDFRAHFCG
jgi:hypothetical protein